MAERFELLEEIGRGGMGVVWKARDLETGQVVALKRLHAGYDHDEDFLQRFEREVEVTRRIESPNVVQVVGYGQQGGVPYLAMELVEGESLRDLIKRRGKLPWSEVRPLARQLATGLAAAHAQRVVHRDVKPSNVIITTDGVAKLADFGIARAGDLTRLTQHSTMLGTPPYMAPDANEDHRSDLYSLGCVLFETLSGTPPFTGSSQNEYFHHHISTPPDLAKLPPEARSVVGWLLQKDPKLRPQSAVALEAVLAGTASPPPNTQRFLRAGEQAKKRRVPVMAMVGALVLLPVVAGGSILGGMALDDGDGVGTSPDPIEVVITATPAQSREVATGTANKTIVSSVTPIGSVSASPGPSLTVSATSATTEIAPATTVATSATTVAPPAVTTVPPIKTTVVPPAAVTTIPPVVTTVVPPPATTVPPVVTTVVPPPVLAIPAPPSSIASCGGGSTWCITWSRSQGATGYHVYVNGSHYTTITGTFNRQEIWVEAGNTYVAQVSAFNASGESALGPTISFTARASNFPGMPGVTIVISN